MRTEHKEIQNWIFNKYKSRYNVLIEIHNQNVLPDKKRHWYQPDVIITNVNNQIKYIIEVENDPMRKVIVGASILADASIKELNQKIQPSLIFIVYMKKGVFQIPNFIEKIKIAKHYCRRLKGIHIYSYRNFQKLEL